MSDRAIRIAGLVAVVVSWGLLAFTWELNARSQRAFAAVAAKNQAERARMKLLLDRQHDEMVELKAMLEKLLQAEETELKAMLGKLLEEEEIRSERERRAPWEGRFD